MLILANFAGFLAANWRKVAVFAGILVLLLGVAVFWRRCVSPPPKLDEREIQKAQKAIAEADRKAMVEILAASDTREANIDKTLQEAERATEDAKKNYSGLTNDELAAELERRARE